MKQVFTLLLCASFMLAVGQDHKLEKMWETDSIVAVPESVLPLNGILYITLIDGAPWEADGKGGVAKLDADGKNYQADWVTGLHAPKGMGVTGNRLYVADISDVVIIDIANGKIEKKIAIDSAAGLNDITVTNNGIVFVSDSKSGKIWRIENDMASLYMENLKGLNGLKSVGDQLIIAAGKSFIKADAQKNTKPIAELAQGGDGIEPVGNGDYIVTAWGGYIWYVHADGRIETLLETHQQKKNTADIGYDPVKKIVYVPTFNAKTVAAYQLK
jgi:hypothetical protein